MTQVKLGRTDISVSRICLGTMTFGEQNTLEDGFAQMDYAGTRGINFFDTAELYAIPPRRETQGATETIIGEWFRARGKRQDIVLATKIVGRSGWDWFRKDGSPTRLVRAQIDEAVENSLRRLQTDYIDLYQLHWPDREVQVFGGMTHKGYGPDFEPFGDILEHLDRHVKAGRIRALGVSNETPWGVMRFLAESERRGLPRIASIQNAYNLVNRVFEYGLSEIAEQEQVGLLAYSPLGQGYLTGKYRGGALPPKSRKALFQRLGRYEGPGAAAAIDSYLDLAKAHGITPEALALKFCDTRTFMTSTIIGATTLEQLQTDIDAFDLVWTRELESAVDALHEAQPNPCP